MFLLKWPIVFNLQEIFFPLKNFTGNAPLSCKNESSCTGLIVTALQAYSDMIAERRKSVISGIFYTPVMLRLLGNNTLLGGGWGWLFVLYPCCFDEFDVNVYSSAVFSMWLRTRFSSNKLQWIDVAMDQSLVDTVEVSLYAVFNCSRVLSIYALTKVQQTLIF